MSGFSTPRSPRCWRIRWSGTPPGYVLSVSPDTDLLLWTLSWDAHALTTHPLSIFDANIFAPLHRTLAFSENLIGSGLFAVPILGLTHNPVLAMNLLALLSCVLCGLGAFHARAAGGRRYRRVR